MKKRQKKYKEVQPLDTETTFVDMNVEGFRWYHPKEQEGKQLPPLTRQERRAMIRGAMSALWPVLIGILAGMLVLVGLAYLWLA